MVIEKIIQKAKEFVHENDLTEKHEVNYKLITQFNVKFPRYELNQTLTLDNYVLRGDKNTFCYWVDFKTCNVADIRGARAQKFNIWSNENAIIDNKYFIRDGIHVREINRDQALREFKTVKENLLRIIVLAETDEFEKIDGIIIFWPIFKMKIGYLYFPNKFTSIMASDDIKKACELFGVEYHKNYPIYSNSILFQKIKAIDFFKNWSSFSIGSLFYYKLFEESSENDECEIAAENTLIRSEGQGIVLDSKLRKQIEDYAMDRAKIYLENCGYSHIRDVSKSKSYDFECYDGNKKLHIEVKGTQTNGKSITLTYKEVQLTKKYSELTILFLVHSIHVEKKDNKYILNGGQERTMKPFEIIENNLKPVSYTYKLNL